MLKQIGIRLEEELITKTKKFGLDNKLSLQQMVAEALTSYLDNKLAPINHDDNMITSENDNKLSITESDPTILDLLRDTQKAIHDPETNYITIYPKIKHIEVDEAHIENEVVFGNDYILAPEEGYDQSLTRDDVDPLYMLPEEEWKAKLEEARRLRG